MNCLNSRKTSYRLGFTLSELLIALAILGVIATFTIPKVLQSQQDKKFNSIAKEVAAMVSDVYQTQKLRGQVSSATQFGHLTPFMNYVATDTSSNIDDVYTLNNLSCNAGFPCLRLHNGAVILWENGQSFGGTATTNAVWFLLDPDGTPSSTTNGPGKSVSLFLYYTGKVVDDGNTSPNAVASTFTYWPAPSLVPPWFSW